MFALTALLRSDASKPPRPNLRIPGSLDISPRSPAQFPAAIGTHPPREMNTCPPRRACPLPASRGERRALCFDNDTKPYCRKPLVLKSIQNPRGYTPLFLSLLLSPNRMNTYAKCAANPCGIRTSKIIGLKASCNEHLQKNGGREGFGCGLYSQPTQILLPSALFVRSFRSSAPERKSTSVFSSACARSCRNGGYPIATTQVQPLREILLSPVSSGVGCTCSPRKRRLGLYLQPTQTTVTGEINDAGTGPPVAGVTQ